MMMKRREPPRWKRRARGGIAVRVESNSLQSLAEELDINVKQFLATVKQYNEAIADEIPFTSYKHDGRCTRGLNPNKTNWAQRIDTPPFQAYAVVCGLTMTYGGLDKRGVLISTDQLINGEKETLISLTSTRTALRNT
jgi:tricarballylate dehydrogenase